MNRFELTGRRALVTGAVSGIGRGIAVALAEHGAEVIVLDRADPDDAAVTALLAQLEASGRPAWYRRHDLRRTEELRPLVRRTWAEIGPVHILVNNAGISALDHYDDVTVQQWRDIMTVNAEAVFFLSQAVAERMVDDGISGRIISVSSKNALVAEAGLAPYNASKAAVELLTKTLAVELGPHGITVNTVAPGMIETGIASDFRMDFERFREYYNQHIPLRGRFGSVEDCVGPVLLLASDAGGYITGQCVVVDGGVLSDQVPRLQFMQRRHPDPEEPADG